nr:MAG TPA: hypothetical protein [Caudoviricetes sp.]
MLSTCRIIIVKRESFFYLSQIFILSLLLLSEPSLPQLKMMVTTNADPSLGAEAK